MVPVEEEEYYDEDEEGYYDDEGEYHFYEDEEAEEEGYSEKAKADGNTEEGGSRLAEDYLFNAYKKATEGNFWYVQQQLIGYKRS